MKDIQSLVRPNILKLKPYSSARDEFSGTEGIFLDANENPYGSLNRYPDPYQKTLKAEIAKQKGLHTEQIFIGNGSDEVIDILYRIFCEPKQDKAITFTPTYGMYKVSAEINDVELIEQPLNVDFQIQMKNALDYVLNNKVKLMFICSPNNPTGNLIHSSDIEHLLNKFNGIVVIDEAYIDFSESNSWSQQIDKYPQLVVMHTFSKARGLASARVGMAFANPDIIQLINKVKPPYNVSALNQQAGIKCFNGFSFIPNSTGVDYK